MKTTKNFYCLHASQALPRLKQLESWEWKDGVVEEIEWPGIALIFIFKDQLLMQ